MKLLALLLVTACLGGGHWPEQVSSRPNGTSRRIQGVSQFQNVYEWQRSGWSRIADGIMNWPVFVVIADDGSACVVSGDVWAIAKAGDYVTCKPWRIARP